jgi:rare lipoprotein A (peptidoglycan hydrolase)
MNAKTLVALIVVLMGATLFAFGFGGAHPPDSPLKEKVASYIREVYAVWYCVPPGSLARRRAGKTEFTAAHNRLPLGTLVRVTNLKNHKSVLVRITDRGITNKRAKIDICKEAAEKIEMVSEGISRVRLEIVPETPLTSTSSPERVAAH